MEKSKTLKKSLEEGIISKEEYEKEKKKIRKKDKKPKKTEKIQKKEEKPKKEITKKSDKVLIIVVSLVLIFIISFIVNINFKSNTRPKTIDELHQTNMGEGLESEQGYTYNQFSFVKVAGLWYTQIRTGNTLYDVPFHFSPKELEDIKLVGTLNNSLFNSEDKIYVTFDPLGSNLQYVALAVGEFDQNIIKSFAKTPVAACIKNETNACAIRPIITCENTNMPVAFFKEDEKTLVTYDDNCIIIQGNELEIVRATNRMLMQFYGIME